MPKNKSSCNWQAAKHTYEPGDKVYLSGKVRDATGMSEYMVCTDGKAQEYVDTIAMIRKIVAKYEKDSDVI